MIRSWLGGVLMFGYKLNVKHCLKNECSVPFRTELREQQKSKHKIFMNILEMVSMTLEVFGVNCPSLIIDKLLVWGVEVSSGVEWLRRSLNLHKITTIESTIVSWATPMSLHRHYPALSGESKSDPQHKETTLIHHRWSQAVKQTRQKSLIGESNQKLWFSASFEKVTLAKFN